jgi:XTP/dITP diphosphohydrolase
MSGLLVLGTGNRKKGQELARLLARTGLQLKTLADYPNAMDVVEDGDSFRANAALKATQQAHHLSEWVLADDSGLAVDCLDGAPGVFSARYSGPGATDESNNQKLLAELKNVTPENRTARFVCHICVADPSGAIRGESSASCRGRILSARSGSGGFGYDPLFEIVEYHRTFGDLSPLVKSYLSHRARATAAIVPRLIELFAGSMPRFAILIHDRPGGLHYDFLLEQGDVLKTWALPQEPAPGLEIACAALADHRPLYLDYEGPISDGRGTVARWDRGTFRTTSWSGDVIIVELSGAKLAGRVELRRLANLPDAWQFAWKA